MKKLTTKQGEREREYLSAAETPQTRTKEELEESREIRPRPPLLPSLSLSLFFLFLFQFLLLLCLWDYYYYYYFDRDVVLLFLFCTFCFPFLRCFKLIIENYLETDLQNTKNKKNHYFRFKLNFLHRFALQTQSRKKYVHLLYNVMTSSLFLLAYFPFRKRTKILF